MHHKYRIGYLISQYPAVSHTFIQREILALRQKGIGIFTASINETNISAEKLTLIDKEEIKATYYVKKQGIFRAIGQMLKMVFTSPILFFQGFFWAVRLARFDAKKLLYNLCYFGEAALLAKWAKKNEIKHIHVHFANPAAMVAMLLSKITSCTYSITVHGTDGVCDATLHNIKEKIEEAAFVFCVSYYAKSQLLSLLDPLSWNKIDVIPLGVDPFFYAPKACSKNAHPFKILCVGRMTTPKGQDIILEVVQNLVKLGKQVHLTYVGDGPDKLRLENRIKQLGLEEIITCKGALNPELTLEEYKKADLFTLLSFAEGVPVVLMEAMSLEIPCIATGINGIPELIKNEINGLLVAPSDVEGSTKAMLRLLDDSLLRCRLGKNGRETILKNYNLNVNIEQLIFRFEERLKRIS